MTALILFTPEIPRFFGKISAERQSRIRRAWQLGRHDTDALADVQVSADVALEPVHPDIRGKAGTGFPDRHVQQKNVRESKPLQKFLWVRC